MMTGTDQQNPHTIVLAGSLWCTFAASEGLDDSVCQRESTGEGGVLYTVIQILEDFAVCIWLMTLLQSSTVCDVKFSQIEGNGRKFSRII